MQISFEEEQQVFHLYNDKISYVIQVEKQRYLKHCYYGKRIKRWHSCIKDYYYDRGFCANPIAEDRTFSLDTQLREFPESGQGDFRSPAYELEDRNGDKNARFFYNGYRILSGKIAPDGLPHVYTDADTEAMTLEITLQDKVRNQRILLYYTIYEDAVVTRFAKWINDGTEPIEICRFLSMNMDLPTQEYDVLTLSGAHTEEKNVYRRPLCADSVTIESSRGTSSPQATPFIGLLSPGTTEEQGEVLGVNLIYSGNFYGCVQCGQYGTIRVQLGINPYQFGWQLAPGTSFCTPEAVLVYSVNGLSGMSNTFHKLYRTRVCRGWYRDRERPVLLNSWEGMYFEINEEKMLTLAEEAAELGIELLVMDDGWFKGRNTDTTSLGDWTEDKKKFPDGLQSLAEKVKQKGIDFGIWFEPEMISRESDLYREHPDWVIRSPLYEPILSRHQLVLDLSNPAVCEYLIEAVSKVLVPGNISYVKWDMNRSLSDVYAGNVTYDYVLGIYEILEKIVIRYPNLLIEGCSGGGGRFDAGMMYYTPQIWCSDNTDAINRVKIQYGTSFFYPISVVGSHVTAVPNHQTGRSVSLITRGVVAMAGTFGYELNPALMSEEEKNIVKQQVLTYKKYESLICEGTYYRLSSPFTEPFAAWMSVSRDKKQALVSVVRLEAEGNAASMYLKCKGLNPDAVYREENTGVLYDGAALMAAGLVLPGAKSEYEAYQFVLKEM